MFYMLKIVVDFEVVYGVLNLCLLFREIDYLNVDYCVFVEVLLFIVLLLVGV